MSRPFYKTRYEWPCTPDCADRKPACHGKCERYLEIRAKRDAELAARFEKSQRDSYMYDAIVRNKNGRVGKGRILYDM